MANNKDVALESAIIYIATDYVQSSSTLPSVTSSNVNTIITQIENDYTFAQVGYARDISWYIDPTTNASTISVDDCDVGDIAQYWTFEWRLEFEWLAIDDATQLSRMLWLTLQTSGSIQLFWFNVEATSIPYLLFKVTSCLNANSQRTTMYLEKAFVDNEIQHTYHNFERVDDVTGSSMVLRNAKWGKFLQQDWKYTDL